ncbi:MAG: hypothetical protein GVX96_06895 [Bacteroidetes bacterium]|jgi:hypothetical protein|nr:hypothetical protein [Bacteroidota bacterium]
MFQRHRIFGIVLCLVIAFNWAHGQKIPNEVKEYIEDYYSIRSDAPDEVDVNIIFDQLGYYLENPVSLNEASRSSLQDLFILSPLQIDAFINYRAEMGPLVDIHELQAIPNMDISTIKRIEPFVTLGKSPSWVQQPLSKLLKEAQATLYVRYNQILEPAKGFRDRGEGEGPAFQGPPGNIFTRFVYRLPKKFSVGMVAEKDPGESFFGGSNPNGFDYTAIHFFLEDPTERINRVAVGDYNISLGQGLILHSGFGGGKTAFVNNIKRGGYSIRPHTSRAENTFMRGGAVDFSISDNWSGLLFYSNRNIDGNLVFATDTLDSGEPNLLSFSSINNMGLHRTETEIAKKGALGDEIMGGRLAYDEDNIQFRLNYFSEQFSAPLNRRDDLYNLFVPQQDRYQFLSADYTYISRYYHFFGETATNGFGVATLNGIMMSPQRRVQMSFMHRYYSPKYFSLNANVFGEVQQAFNEHGFYAGFNWDIPGPLRLSAYADVWTHPWLRFNVDAPSRGNEYLLRLEYYKKRQFSAYLQIRNKTRARNRRIDDARVAEVLPLERLQMRLHLSQKLTKALELRYRGEWLRATQMNQAPTYGYLLYGDMIYKPMSYPVSFTSRFAVFKSEDFNSRLYAFENNLLYSFSIPAYFDQGVRTYINVRWKLSRGILWEARFARTWINQAETIGSGQNEIEGNTRTELATQIKLTF